jgi:hypothetical protein
MHWQVSASAQFWRVHAQQNAAMPQTQIAHPLAREDALHFSCLESRHEICVAQVTNQAVDISSLDDGTASPNFLKFGMAEVQSTGSIRIVLLVVQAHENAACLAELCGHLRESSGTPCCVVGTMAAENPGCWRCTIEGMLRS